MAALGPAILVHLELAVQSAKAPHTSQYALRNNHSLVQFSAHTNCFYYSFFPYVTSLWNTLPDSITSAPSIYTFKNLVHLV